MRGRLIIAAAGVLLLIVAGVAYVVVVAPDATPGVRGLSAAGTTFTDSDGLVAPGPFTAAFSPNGAKLAVLSAAGISLSDRGRLTPVLKQNVAGASRVVEMAWMPSSDRLLVAEGPAPARRLNVIDLTGKVVAAATLSQPLSLDEGFGMAVDSTNRKAALIQVNRDAVGGRRHLDLAVVDLQNGAVRILPTPDIEESHPYFVDDNHVLVTADSSVVTRASVVDLADGSSLAVGSKATMSAGVLTDTDVPVYQTLGETAAVWAPGHKLGDLDKGAVLVALHPTGSAGVERLAPDAEGATRLRVIALNPLRH